MSGFLFLIVMDWVMRRAVGSGEKFTLDFADDIVLLSSTKRQIQDKTTRLNEEARRVGLKKINEEKTKALRINVRNHEKIIINGQGIEDIDELVYLGAKVCHKLWPLNLFFKSSYHLPLRRKWYEGLDEQVIESKRYL